MRQTRRLDEVDDGHLRKVQAVYLGMTSFMDHLLGMLLETLEETGHADDTTVVYFSDHGDWAGDYGLVEKWPSAVEDVLARAAHRAHAGRRPAMWSTSRSRCSTSWRPHWSWPASKRSTPTSPAR
ncbi:MAG: sulfatase-like hydrolase/transferase [Caldilineaceae bacterium]